MMWFDRDRCADGLQDLRRYRFDVDERGQFSRKPAHDAASHASDALRYCAIAIKERERATYKEPPKLPRVFRSGRGNLDWMAR